MANIFKQLSQEHEEVRELLLSLAIEPDPTVFDEMRRNLLAHAKAEESEVYSVVRSLEDELALKIDDAFQAHHELEKLIEAMHQALGKDMMFWELREELADRLEHHVEEEEGEMFALIEKHFTEGQLVEMCNAYVQTKRAMMESIRPVETGRVYVETTSDEEYEGRPRVTRVEGPGKPTDK
jgi:hypothetical protein